MRYLPLKILVLSISCCCATLTKRELIQGNPQEHLFERSRKSGAPLSRRSLRFPHRRFRRADDPGSVNVDEEKGPCSDPTTAASRKVLNADVRNPGLVCLQVVNLTMLLFLSSLFAFIFSGGLLTRQG